MRALRSWWIAVISGIVCLPLASAAQTADGLDDARLVEVRVEPEEPHFGQAFELHVTLRLRPGVVAILPDTLRSGDGVHTLGSGTWEEAPAPGDSAEVRVVYPMIGFRQGVLTLPNLELWIRASSDPDGLAAAALSASDPLGASTTEIERRVARLGSVTVAPFPAFLTEGVVLEPRAAADVLGREWSVWRILAVGLGLVGTVALIVVVVPRWWEEAGAAWVARLRGRSPKQQALKELERIRQGGLADVRLEEFYASSTDTLRAFAARIEPTWTTSLTSTELLSKFEERWGTGELRRLPATIEVAERVKFAAHRPDDDAAEEHWRTIRNWIRDAPEN